MYPSGPSAAGYAAATQVATLLAQRPPWSDRSQPDQLLVHLAPHASDLLLHAAGQDLHHAAEHAHDGRLGAATALVVRATRIVDAATVTLRLLQHATPRDDHIVELALRLSGPTTSPGWRKTRHGALSLDTAVNVALTTAGIDLRQGLDPAQPLYRLVEAMAGLDLAARAWRDQRHTLAAGLTAPGPARSAPDLVVDPQTLFPSLAATHHSRARESP